MDANTDCKDVDVLTGDIIEITHDKLDIQVLSQAVTLPECGAVSTFLGTTRDNFDGKTVERLEYECYTSMAVKEFKKICVQMREKWDDLGRIAISHRLGLVPVCEASVIIAVSSPHRQNALQAVEYCINTLKATVPIWKKEVYKSQDSEWKCNKEFTLLQQHNA